MSGGKKSPIVVAAEYLSLATLLPASTFAGYLVGYLLDRWLGTTFLWIVFLILGTAGALIEIIRRFQRDTRENGR